LLHGSIQNERIGCGIGAIDSEGLFTGNMKILSLTEDGDAGINGIDIRMACAAEFPDCEILF
jgi:hypothetical protein